MIAWPTKIYGVKFTHMPSINPQVILPCGGKKGKKNAGVLDYYKVLFNEGDFQKYLDILKKRKPNKTLEELKKYYLTSWRTFQMSDHLLKWVELKIDFSDRYLEHRRDEFSAELKKKST